MKNYNTKVSVQLDFNFLSSAGDSLSPNEIKAGIVNMLNSIGVQGISNLQGYQENNIKFVVEEIVKMPSPEDIIENDLAEFDIF